MAFRIASAVEFGCPDAGFAVAAAVVGRRDHADYYAAGPGVLEEVAGLGDRAGGFAGRAFVFVGTSGLKDLGYRLGRLVGEIPVGGDVAGVAELVGDLDEVGVELAEVFPDLGRRLPVSGVPPAGEIWIGEDQIAVSVETVGAFCTILLEGGSPLLAQEGEEAVGVFVDCGPVWPCSTRGTGLML